METRERMLNHMTAKNDVVPIRRMESMPLRQQSSHIIAIRSIMFTKCIVHRKTIGYACSNFILTKSRACNALVATIENNGFFFSNHSLDAFSVDKPKVLGVYKEPLHFLLYLPYAIH